MQNWIARHRLERVNPADPTSRIKNPIVYSVDRGIPEPMRTATFQGVSWWADAFDQAGLKGAFKVEWLPEGADPMDVRYNVVQWENRNERGWSVGGALSDPRTGEMLKGMARSRLAPRAHRIYNIYAAFMGADASAADTAFVLARVRQVSAHEVGHTLGLGHNYIASTYGRASVMDYPAPRILLKNGQIDLSDAYGVGPGAYDVWAIHWGYGIFPPGQEADSLKAIMADGLRKGYLYLSDADARPENAADPRTNLWDDAATPGDFLKHEVEVRRLAMSRFGLRNVRDGDPLSLLQDRFPLLYFFHRFAINSVTKTIGGMEYSNPLKGDGQQATRPISGVRQREALASLIAELAPQELAHLPDTGARSSFRREASIPAGTSSFSDRTRRRRLRRTRRRANARADDHRRHSPARAGRPPGAVRLARHESADAGRDHRQAGRGDMGAQRAAPSRSLRRAAAHHGNARSSPTGLLALAADKDTPRRRSSRDGEFKIVQLRAKAESANAAAPGSGHAAPAHSVRGDRRRLHALDRASRTLPRRRRHFVRRRGIRLGSRRPSRSVVAAVVPVPFSL